MKRGTLEKAKLRLLAKRLGVSISHAVGILECLWHTTASCAPRGDIGRLEDEIIAESCFWEGEAPDLIEALVKEHWLDRHDEHRLIVHHWSEHADDAVHKRLADKGETFADGARSRRDKSG